MAAPDDGAGAQAGGVGAVGARWPEVVVALVLMALAALVLTDSLRVGIGWGDDGPRSGYFPFGIGVLLMASAGSVLVSQLLRWRQVQVFAQRSQLRDVMALLLPMALYVAAIRPAGIYVASALLIGWFMLRHGKHHVGLTLAVAIGVPLAFFAVFERWFLVPLPKGPLEALFGL